MPTAMERLDEEWARLPAVLREAMQVAAKKPGRYGGRYVARRYNRGQKRTEFLILASDDPDAYRDELDIDILAQATPDAIHAIGCARHYIHADGHLEFHDRDGSVKRFD